ncbi:MAG: 5-oxoprolinase subunit PxpB [Burkholderiaceae bacterium]|nr:5-oxoprolinase subunit PxpB [Burkholderiaceae bacterium]
MDGELARGWRIEAAGDRCLIVELGTRVDPQINRRVHALASRLIAARIEGVSDVVPAFTTVAVHYRPEKLPGSASGESPHARLEKTVEALLASGADAFAAEARTVEIPVCYGGDFGPDLDEVASACSLSAGRVIELHGASPHLVYMLGFAPGFPYMGGLDPRLAMPRRSTPRLKIAAGTVAIAREQSAIYTLQTPGGWNLIGRTPLTFFRPDADPPSLLRPGDRVRFVAVSRERYDEIAERVRADLERAPGDSR